MIFSIISLLQMSFYFKSMLISIFHPAEGKRQAEASPTTTEKKSSPTVEQDEQIEMKHGNGKMC
jgi:hypothetical protein